MLSPGFGTHRFSVLPYRGESLRPSSAGSAVAAS
ncbi:MAG: hypothetical protein JWR16_2749 [Nevskia sp.]|nr:hypothetical protein [Nevskia sp.]